MNRTAMILFPLFRLAHSEVAERIRDFDWTSTDTGPISDWLNDVQTAVTICADIASAQQPLGENSAWSWLPHSFGHDAPP
jgi:hypothetical protein